MYPKRYSLIIIAAVVIFCGAGVFTFLLSRKNVERRSAAPPIVSRPATPIIDTSIRLKRYQSLLSGKILKISKEHEGRQVISFLHTDTQKEYSIGIFFNTVMSTKTIDSDKNVISLHASANPAEIKLHQNDVITVVTNDPLESSGPLRALQIIVNNPPSKKP